MTQVSSQTIRLARPEDAEPLSRLKLDTFRETFLHGFGIPYPEADLRQFETETYTPERIRAEIGDPLHRTWVVEEDGQLVAYAHAGPCKLPHAEALAGHSEIYQIYLRKSVQGAGLGSRLLDFVIAELERRGAPIWLGVWSGNHKAQALYHSRGFKNVGEYKYRVGTWFDEEYVFYRPAKDIETA